MQVDHNDIKDYLKLEQKIRETSLQVGQSYKIKHPNGEFVVEITSIKSKDKIKIVSWYRDSALLGVCSSRDFIKMMLQVS